MGETKKKSAIYRKLDVRRKMHISGHACVHRGSYSYETKAIFRPYQKLNSKIQMYVEIKMEWIKIFGEQQWLLCACVECGCLMKLLGDIFE